MQYTQIQTEQLLYRQPSNHCTYNRLLGDSKVALSSSLMGVLGVVVLYLLLDTGVAGDAILRLLTYSIHVHDTYTVTNINT